MKQLSAKSWLWLLLLLIPLTFYITENLVTGAVMGVPAFLFSLLFSVPGVLLGFVFYWYGLQKLQRLSLYYVWSFVLIIIAMLLLALLINLTGLYLLSENIIKNFLICFNTSAFVLAFGTNKDNH